MSTNICVSILAVPSALLISARHFEEKYFLFDWTASIMERKRSFAKHAYKQQSPLNAAPYSCGVCEMIISWSRKDEANHVAWHCYWAQIGTNKLNRRKWRERLCGKQTRIRIPHYIRHDFDNLVISLFRMTCRFHRENVFGNDNDDANGGGRGISQSHIVIYLFMRCDQMCSY